MGRRIPLGDDPLIHPFISLSLMVASMAAIIAIVTSLCSFWKKSSPSKKLSSSSSNSKSNENSSDPFYTSSPNNNVETSSLAIDHSTNQTLSSEDSKDLPLPPSMKKMDKTYSCNNFATKTKSTRRSLSTSLSVKVPRSLSFSVKKHEHEEKQMRKKAQMKIEDSILIKPIILGGKCKVPDEEDDIAVLFDKKGKRITSYHPKTSTSFSIHRTTSLFDKDDFGNEDKDIDKDKDEDEDEEKDVVITKKKKDDDDDEGVS